jgi:hypothetical protein
MAAGPSKSQAREFTYRAARRVLAKAKREGGYLIGASIHRKSEDGAWCPHYEVVSHHDCGGDGRRTFITQVRMIRASNGEAAVITEGVDAS